MNSKGLESLFDIIIKNGKIIDGSGSIPFLSDIGINGDSIEYIGRTRKYDAKKVIDATGAYVSPGFIDMHSHGDCTVPMAPDMQSNITQGITTSFTGHCGLGIAPADRYWTYMFTEKAAFRKVMEEPPNGHIPGFSQIAESDKLRPVMKETMGFEFDWSSFGEYLDHLKREGLGANLLPAVGHGSIRMQVMGLDFKRAAQKEEVEKMKEYLTASLEGGACGMSYGLDYEPGLYAEFYELVELAKCLKPYNAILTAHCQSRDLRFGVRKKQYYINGLKEMLEVAKSAGIHFHVSHLLAGYEYAPEDDDMAVASAKRTLQVIEEYRAQGVNVTFDVLPPGVGGPFHKPQLANKLMPWVKKCGGLKQLGINLRNSGFRKEMSDTIRGVNGQLSNGAGITLRSGIDPVNNPEWDTKIQIHQCMNMHYEGKTIKELADSQEKDSVDMLLDILTEDPYAYYVPSAAATVRNAAGINIFVNHPDASIGMDCGIFDFNWAPSDNDFPVEYPAPSTYCGMVKYIVQRSSFPIEDTIRKITGKPAEILGLSDRGLIKEGMKADIVIFNPDTLETNECFVDSRVAPSGIDHVLVNGKAALEFGEQCLSRSGRILKRE